MSPDQAFIAGSVLGLLIREVQTSAELRGLRVVETYDNKGDYAPVILLKDEHNETVLTIEVHDERP